MKPESNFEFSNSGLIIALVVSLIAAYISQIFLSSFIVLFEIMPEDYTLKWVVNDIIVYAPALFVTPLIMRRYSLPRESFPPSRFKWAAIVPLFTAMYSLSTVALLVSHFIADLFTRLYGTEGLKDIFESVMPENQLQWLVILFFVGIVAPFAEEIIFRHILLRPLRRLGDRPAIIITALLFGAFHQNLTQFLYAAVAGVILGIVAVRANSVKPAIVLHILNNTFDIGKLYLFESVEKGKIPIDGNVISAAIFLFFIAGIIITIVLIMRNRK